MIFPEFVGNEAVKRRIEAMLSGNRMPHAIVIEGPPGSGRRTLARLLARTVACTGKDRPCGMCAACRNGMGNPDITEVPADTPTVPVDTVRELRNRAYIKATQSAARVFLIPEAQRMNPQAQNALLKVLEEPPEGVMFLLTCDYTRQLLDTVVSRVSVLSLSAPERAEVEEYIASAYPQYDRDAIRRAYAVTVGATLARLEGQEGYAALAEETARALFGGELALHKRLRPLEKDRAAQKGLAAALEDLCHDALAIRMGAPRDCERENVRRELAGRLTAEQLMELIGVCRRAVGDCDANMSGALLVTDFCARLFRAVR